MCVFCLRKYNYIKVHGYADHSNAYPKLVEFINKNDGAVFSHEHFAHGNSGPYEKNDRNRCQIDNLSNAARDLKSRIELIKIKYPNRRILIHGHSMVRDTMNSSTSMVKL